jgi:hypothetical protein
MIEFSGFVVNHGEIVQTHNLTENEEADLQETVATIAAIDELAADEDD